MADQVQWRRGTTAQTQLFIGAQGEVTVDTDKNTLVVHDDFTPGGFPLATEEQLSDGTFYFNDDVGGGSSANAYILVPKPNTNTPNSYQDGILLGFVTANANTGPASANFQGLGVKNIKYPGGIDPAPGDVSGRVTLIFDAGNDWLELQRKPTGDQSQISNVAASVSANALTITIEPRTIDFRSTVLSSGATVSRVLISAANLVVPSGATLGTVSGTQSRIAIIAIDNAGTIEPAVVNIAGTNVLDETSLISTTAISAAANSANVFYSQTARAGVAYRVVGYVQSTQAAAGTWATPPSQVQGQGGQALFGVFRIVPGTAQNTSSGTSIDYTGIPAGVRKITATLAGVSVSGSSPMQFQIGSGSIVTTGYSGGGARAGGATIAAASITTGVSPANATAAATYSGNVHFTRVSGNTWAISGVLGASGGTESIGILGGSITLSGELDRIRLTTINGTDTFDAGSMNIMWEF